jgi:hypothetical protein
MKERDVRQRIESFLKRTAREVVVPASVGIGLALSGCDRTGMKIGGDAAADMSRSARDAGSAADAAVVNHPDMASQPDARQPDLPFIAPPYMAVFQPDARVAALPDVGADLNAPDASADVAGPEAGRDAARDMQQVIPPYMPPPQPDARQADLRVSVPPDAARDMPVIMPPYLSPPPPPPPDARAVPPDAPLSPLPPPPPPYMAVPFQSLSPDAELPAKTPK